MLVPGFAVGWGVVYHAKLAYRMDGMGIEIGRATMQAVVCGTGAEGSGFHGRWQLRVSSIVGSMRCHRSGGKEIWQDAREAIR